jgi:hypothetical protein
MASIESIFNHFVLPPQLPDHRDQDPEAVSSAILTRLLKAYEVFEEITGDEWAGEWAGKCAPLGWSLRTSQGIHQRRLEANLLLEDWANFRSQDLLILHIVEQNAALLLHRNIRQVKQDV